MSELVIDEKLIQEMFDPSRVKKKRKNRKLKSKISLDVVNGQPVNYADDVYDGEPLPTYREMLAKIYHTHSTKNTTIKVSPPRMVKVRAKYSVWVNFTQICSQLNRDRDFVAEFFQCELATSSSYDEKGSLILKGKFSNDAIEKLLVKFINEYVKCHMCGVLDSYLKRDNLTRLRFLNCNTCMATRSVKVIQVGFRAMAKGQRRRDRMKA